METTADHDDIQQVFQRYRNLSPNHESLEAHHFLVPPHIAANRFGPTDQPRWGAKIEVAGNMFSTSARAYTSKSQATRSLLPIIRAILIKWEDDHKVSPPSLLDLHWLTE